MKKLEDDLNDGQRKVEVWANSVGVKVINMEFINNDPFFNINTKLLTFAGIKPKHNKQLTGKCKILYIEDSSNYPEEVRTIKKVKKKSKNKDERTNQSNLAKGAVAAGIVSGVAVGAYYVSNR